MLIIRLHRVGRIHKPFYRVVLAEKHKHVSKKFIHNFGTYNPVTKELNIREKENLKKYLDLNVELSDTVRALLKKGSYVK